MSSLQAIECQIKAIENHVRQSSREDALAIAMALLNATAAAIEVLRPSEAVPSLTLASLKVGGYQTNEVPA
ncbi:hypothetical protein WI560_15485 [Bradyrhizobium sp. A11]|uniref:hypothetical protein n=1 Tax=Bradyrhizobium sp. A11 TaxID=3133974 RepID=UPI0032537076